VEGRADVLALLKHGIKNSIAVEGTNVPKTITELIRKKTTTVFVDGDRGGDLILKELSQLGEIDFIARAPNGKEVEELTKKEIFKALRNKVPAEQVIGSTNQKSNTPPKKQSVQGSEIKKIPEEKSNGKSEVYKKLFKDLSGTFKAYLLDEDSNIIKEVAVRDLASALQNSKEKVSVVIFDGVITQRLVEISSQKEVGHLIGAKIGNIVKKPTKIKLLTASDIESS
jgi:DNA primase